MLGHFVLIILKQAVRETNKQTNKQNRIKGRSAHFDKWILHSQLIDLDP